MKNTKSKLITILKITGIVAMLILAIKVRNIYAINSTFEEANAMVGISNSDYRIKRSLSNFSWREPDYVQKIKLNRKGREKIDVFIDSKADSILIKSVVYEDIKINTTKNNIGRISNSLDTGYNLWCHGSELDRLCIYKSGKYIEIYYPTTACYYWRMILDREKYIIYRELSYSS